MEALEFAQEELAPRGEENVSGFRFHVYCHPTVVFLAINEITDNVLNSFVSPYDEISPSSCRNWSAQCRCWRLS